MGKGFELKVQGVGVSGFRLSQSTIESVGVDFGA
jgi:hypothetical protein